MLLFPHRISNKDFDRFPIVLYINAYAIEYDWRNAHTTNIHTHTPVELSNFSMNHRQHWKYSELYKLPVGCRPKIWMEHYLIMVAMLKPKQNFRNMYFWDGDKNWTEIKTANVCFHEPNSIFVVAFNIIEFYLLCICIAICQVSFFCSLLLLIVSVPVMFVYGWILVVDIHSHICKKWWNMLLKYRHANKYLLHLFCFFSFSF